MTRIVGVIPARMASSRFPGKPLVEIAGQTMLGRVYRAAAEFFRDGVPIVATCDEEIAAFCRLRGFPYRMTEADHPRALDRVAEVADGLGLAQTDIVLCIQGDEPLVRVWEFHRLIATYANASLHDGEYDPGEDIVILGRPVTKAERKDRNQVKLITDLRGRMLYSTRAAVPASHRIAGVFAFSYGALQMFQRLSESPLEIAESCDSNRLVDNGIFPQVAVVDRAVPAVDVPEDVARVEEYLRQHEAA